MRPYTCALVVTVLLGCTPDAPRASQPVTVQTLDQARGPETVKLVRQTDAPQQYDASLSPPAGVERVAFTSGDLKLWAWFAAPAGQTRHPAVVYCHGGFAFAQADWVFATPFLQAGFAVMTPTLRAENGNPGYFERFHGEVDDVIAAGRWLASRPEVDPTRLFVTGHSIGATLSVLAAMLPSPYAYAVALDGSVNWEEAYTDQQEEPFDIRDRMARRVRSPHRWVGSLQIPCTLIVAQETDPYELLSSQAFAADAALLGKRVNLLRVAGDHWSCLEPAVRKAVRLFSDFRR